MFGTFPFGQPYFAQGSGEGAAAQLAVSATLAVGVSASTLTKPAADLTAVPSLRVSVSAADLTKPAATLAASATFLFATIGNFVKVPAALLGAPVLRFSSTGATLTGISTPLGAAATFRLSTSVALSGSRAALAGTARLAVRAPAATLTIGAGLLATATTVVFRATAFLSQLPVFPTSKVCSQPLPVETVTTRELVLTAPVRVMTPARVWSPPGPTICTPRAAPPLPAAALTPAERVCHQALPVDPVLAAWRTAEGVLDGPSITADGD